MVYKIYLLNLTLLLAVCFVHGQEESTVAPSEYSSTMTSTVIYSEPFTSDSRTVSSLPSDSPNIVTDTTSNGATGEQMQQHSTDTITIGETNTAFTTETFQSSTGSMTSSAHASITNITDKPGNTINGSYIYTIVSDINLPAGILNDTAAKDSVNNLVNSSFSRTDISFVVTSIEIKPQSRDTTRTFSMIVNITFTTKDNNCNKNCIDASIVEPNVNITLLVNGTSVIASPQGKPKPVDSPTPIEIRRGGPSPGVPAQLGMGLGISIMGILLAAEIIFLYRKYGLSNTRRPGQYAMTQYS